MSPPAGAGIGVGFIRGDDVTSNVDVFEVLEFVITGHDGDVVSDTKGNVLATRDQ